MKLDPKTKFLFTFILLIFSSIAFAQVDFRFLNKTPEKVIEVSVHTPEQRTEITNLGYALEEVLSDKVFLYGHQQDVERLSRLGYSVRSWELKPEWLSLEGAPGAAQPRFTSLAEVEKRLESLATNFSAIASLETLGRSVEGREQKVLRLSSRSKAEAESLKLPVAFYMGCHHAREHLSVEVPLMFAEYLANQYGKNAVVTRLLENREIYIAPVINPDGHVFDYSDGIRGRMWRKNRRRNNDGSFGVDLNRNYGFMWGTGGSSSNPGSDVYMGPAPFSEPESMNVRDFILSQPRMSVLISFHTFSELILYPWGHTYDRVGDKQGKPEDRAIFEKMANTMARWNGYKPQQSSALYIASGDTTDWAYGERGIFAFTFELSPKTLWEGGFYPNPNSTIQPTFNKNLNPMLYLLEYADNPKRVLTDNKDPFTIISPVRAGLPIADPADVF